MISKLVLHAIQEAWLLNEGNNVPFRAMADAAIKVILEQSVKEASAELLLEALERLLQSFQGDWPTVAVAVDGPSSALWVRARVDDETRDAILWAHKVIAKAQGKEISDDK